MLWVFSIRAKGSRGCPDCSYLFLFTTTTCPWIMDTTNLQRLQSNQRCSLFPERLSYMHVYAYLYVYIIIMIIIVIIIIINNNNSNNNNSNNNNIIIIIYIHIYIISLCVSTYIMDISHEQQVLAWMLKITRLTVERGEDPECCAGKDKLGWRGWHGWLMHHGSKYVAIENGHL